MKHYTIEVDKEYKVLINEETDQVRIYRNGFELASVNSFEIAIIKMAKELKQKEDENDVMIKELKELLDIAECPDSCDEGTLTDNHGNPVQCEFCYRRLEVMLKNKSEEEIAFEKYYKFDADKENHYQGCRYEDSSTPINECDCDCYEKRAFFAGASYASWRASNE